jgi:hypothetical protein
MKRLMIYIPFLILLGDGISFIMYHTKWYDAYAYLYSETFGHSIFPVMYMAYFGKRLNYCAFSIVSIYTLLAVNLLNIIYFFVPLMYYELYIGVILSCGTILAVIKWTQRQQASY